MDAEKLAALKADLIAKHGPDVLIVKVSDGRVFAFRKAGSADWRKHKAAMMGIVAGRTAEAAAANELAARSLCVHPPDAGVSFDALRDEAPDLADQIGAALIGKVGSHLEASLGEA